MKQATADTLASARVRTPCEHCPWRVGVDAWAIGRNHTPEVPPLHRRQMEKIAAEHASGGFHARAMACHLTCEGEARVPPQNRVCAGYMLQVAADNLKVRMMVMDGKIDPRAFVCTEPLHTDFAAMLAANPARSGDAP